MHNGNDVYSIRLGSETLVLGQFSNQYTWTTGRHCNAEYELHIILQGCCSLEVEDQQLILAQNQAVLIPPGQYHHPKSVGKDFERFSLPFTVADGSLLRVLQTGIPSCKVFSVTPEVLRICRNVAYESTAANVHRQEMLTALLTQLLIHIERLLQLPRHNDKEACARKEASAVGQIDNFFERNFAGHAGRSELARQLHLSERQLLRVLQKSYGMGFQEKLIHTRMDHASWLLRTTEYTVTEIAGRVGYASEAAFFQVFKSHFQMTPQQYRNRFKAQ